MYPFRNAKTVPTPCSSSPRSGVQSKVVLWTARCIFGLAPMESVRNGMEGTQTCCLPCGLAFDVDEAILQCEGVEMRTLQQEVCSKAREKSCEEGAREENREASPTYWPKIQPLFSQYMPKTDGRALTRCLSSTAPRQSLHHLILALRSLALRQRNNLFHLNPSLMMTMMTTTTATATLTTPTTPTMTPMTARILWTKKLKTSPKRWQKPH